MTAKDFDEFGDQLESTEDSPSKQLIDRKGQARKRPDYCRKRGPVRKSIKARRQRKIQW